MLVLEASQTFISKIHNKNNMQIKKQPTTLGKCPIVEAVIEFRFSDHKIDELFSMIFSVLQSEFNYVRNDSLFSIPESIRSEDENLKYQNHYLFKKENFLIGISPCKMSFSLVSTYTGWETFLSTVQDIFQNKLHFDTKLNIQSIGIKYIDFFPSIDMFENLTIQCDTPKHIQEDNTKKHTKKYLFDYVSPENFDIALKIFNNMELNAQELSQADLQQKNTGSIIDLDIRASILPKQDWNETIKQLEKIHTKNKSIFYDLIKEDFLKTLEPIYSTK